VLTIAASEQRSQLANRQAARVRLADLLRDAIAPPPRPRVPTRPGRAANERRLQAKRSRAAVKRTRRYDDRNPDLARLGGRAVDHLTRAAMIRAQARDSLCAVSTSRS
jgi:hypothetical protein